MAVLSPGVALAAKAMKPEIRIVGVEPVGATLQTSVKSNAVTVLDQINTQAITGSEQKCGHKP